MSFMFWWAAAYSPIPNLGWGLIFARLKPWRLMYTGVVNWDHTSYSLMNIIVFFCYSLSQLKASSLIHSRFSCLGLCLSLVFPSTEFCNDSGVFRALKLIPHVRPHSGYICCPVSPRIGFWNLNGGKKFIHLPQISHSSRRCSKWFGNFLGLLLWIVMSWFTLFSSKLAVDPRPEQFYSISPLYSHEGFRLRHVSPIDSRVFRFTDIVYRAR